MSLTDAAEAAFLFALPRFRSFHTPGFLFYGKQAVLPPACTCFTDAAVLRKSSFLKKRFTQETAFPDASDVCQLLRQTCWSIIYEVMKTFRKKLSVFAAGILSLCILTPAQVSAEDEDFSDTAYWNSLCTGENELTEEQQASCQAYMQYMKKQNQKLESQIQEIDSRKEQISASIANYAQQIEGFNVQIAGINGIIEDLNMQIKAIEEQIADINHRIEENEKASREKEEQIEQLKAKVGSRMEEQQKTMRLNQIIDILFGAKSFDSFIRLANGLNDIYARDNYSLTQLNDSIVELDRIREQLLEDQDNVKKMEAELEEGKAVLDAQQAALLSARYELEAVRADYNRQLASADSELSSALGTIEANKEAMSSISESLKATPKPGSSSASSEEETSDPEPEDPVSEEKESSSEAPSSPSSPISSGSGENPYWGGWTNCTWGCWQLVHDSLGISLPGWGMAGNWLSDAAASGYATGSAPRANSIVVFNYHVGFVTQVNGDQIYIKEGNYLGRYNERWVPASGTNYTGQTVLGYIYL